MPTTSPGLAELRDRTHCMTVMGDQTKADVVAMRVADGDKVTIEGLSLDVMYTPGHTDDSYSYLMGDRVFTGDTLLIRGTGRTDFQNGSSRAQYESIFNRAAQAAGRDDGVPGARLQGRHRLHHRRGEALQSTAPGALGRRIYRADGEPEAAQSEDDGRGGARQHARRPASGRAGKGEAARSAPSKRSARSAGRDMLLVDLRESNERDEARQCSKARCTRPIRRVEESLKPGGMLREVAAATGRRVVFFCAFGERSAMAVAAAKEAGLTNTAHIAGWHRRLEEGRRTGGAELTPRTRWRPLIKVRGRTYIAART